jgi:hypothetical protein
MYNAAFETGGSGSSFISQYTMPSNIIPHIHQTRDFTQRHRKDVAKDSFTE